MIITKITLLVTVLLSLGVIQGCASKPVFETENVDQALTPKAVIEQIETFTGQKVLWGGTILDLKNLETQTQIELLAYPLSASDRPLLDQDPIGRFIVKQAGFLEPTRYVQGRWLTILGEVEGLDLGKVGDTTYQYPVIRAQQIHLWPRPGESTRGRVQFGIGISIHN